MTTVRGVLSELGVGANYKGHKRVVLALQLVQANENQLCNVTALYHEVAALDNCTWYAVERSIRTVVNCAWNRNPKRLAEIAGYPLSASPTTTEFMAILYNYIVRQRADGEAQR